MLLQERLGLSSACLAFDINQGCAGYVYGLSTLSALLSASGLRRALLLVGDTITRFISEDDKSTAPIFSDAGTATALEFSAFAPPMHFNLQTDGKGYEAIMVPDGGARNPLSPKSFHSTESSPGIHRAPNQMAMQGLAVFNFGLREVAPNILALLDRTGKTTGEIDFFVFHQANLLLNEAIRKKLGLPSEKVPYSIRKYGNTSGATIPLTLVSELQEELKKGPLRLVLSGFGVGLSWGSALIEVENITVPGIMEI